MRRLRASMTVRFQMLNTFKRKTNSQGDSLLANAHNRGIGFGRSLYRELVLLLSRLTILFEELIEQTSAFIAS
jgi:hypothetical protein